MQKEILSFGNRLKNKLANIKDRWSSAEILTKWYQGRNTGLAVDTDFYEIARGVLELTDRKISVCKHANEVMVEFKKEGKTEQIAIYDGTGKISIAEVNDSGSFTPFSTSHKGSIIKAAILYNYLSSDTELADNYNELRNLCVYADDDAAWDDVMMQERLSRCLCHITNNIYYHYKSENNSLKVNIEQLRLTKVKKFSENCDVVEGTPSFAKPKEKKVMQLSVGEFSISPRSFSKEEKEMIPVMADSYVYPAWVKSVCEDLKDSTTFKQPIRNVLLTGSAGTGKTKGAQAIASAMGLPYVKVTCSPDTDIYDLVGQMLPNTGVNVNIPTFDDVEFDFEETFKKLFGREPGKYDEPVDCYKEINRLSIDSKDFTYVESDFIKAIKNGYVVEIQEPTVIKREAVLVGLNALLENDQENASYTLPTGEIIKKHPECIIILTTNSDYKGCKSLQQSVLSRMDMVREIPLPTDETLIKRCKALIGFTNETLLKKMVSTIKAINEYCTEHDITDGITGPRELNNWAKKSLMLAARWNEELTDSVIIAAAFPTLLTKVSQVPEEMEEVITGAFQKYFNQAEVENARLMYEAGEI